MPAPALKIAAAEKELPMCLPSLMPFHVDYSGPAPIDTFFRVTDAPEDTARFGATAYNSNEPEKPRFVASFRGRTVHGLDFPLPEGYAGIVLKGEATGEGSASNVPRRAIETREMKGTGRKKQTRRSTRAASRAAKFVDVDEDEDDGTEADVMVIDDDETSPKDAADDEDMRILKPSATFSSLRVWSADIPVDEGRDEYLRAIAEWSSVSAEVHRVED